ncbi:MAG: methyltransferase [Pseudohongiella sp.]|nr:MAG: methyltransferase [Pseudohongiella sp.]
MNLEAIEKSAAAFFSCEQADARRVFHGRGQLHAGLEHISIDWFRPLLLITAHSQIEDIAGLQEILLRADSLGQIQTIVLQNRFERGAPAQTLYGAEAVPLVASEGSLRFEVRPGAQQNTGLFLDMRCLREWLLDNSRDANVLNLFAYTCSLSVAALAGGAKSVTNVDMSKPSIKWGEENHALNEQDLRCVKSIPHNLFKSWGRIKQFGRYDIVIIDPPTRQRGSFDAAKNYAAVMKKLKSLCLPNAKVIATLNSPFQSADYLVELFGKHNPGGSYLGEMAVASEFEDKYPERGLNICLFEMPPRADIDDS